METTALAPNTLAFIALCNEFCQACELADESTADDFVASMTRLLPRIYISASSLPVDMLGDSAYLPAALEEDYYDTIRRKIEILLGEDDTFLEVFEHDMKYSDTPIGASVSEALSDLFQVFYNFLAAVKEAPDEVIAESVGAVADDFAAYWSQTLVNVMRPLNSLHHKI